MHSVDASLRRLGTDYIDLYIIHRFDYQTPIEETVQALHDVVKGRKALYLGASSMHAYQFAKILYTADQIGVTRFVSMENHYNLVYRGAERDIDPALPRRRHRCDALESTCSWISRRQRAAGRFWRYTAREDRRIRPEALFSTVRFQGCGSIDRNSE
jgi:aryl-alcohol dehydrogenase-like predicted oxidoreductase